MSSTLRIVDTGLSTARRNVAITAALGALHASGQIEDLIRFHRYPACILLGQSQDADRCADLAFCAREGIEIARRLTGGGAVLMTSTMLAWDVILNRRAAGNDIGSATTRICDAFAAGLRQLGIPTRYRAPGEIESGGKKVSGSAGWTAGNSLLLQGSLMIEDDLSLMSAALRIPHQNLQGRLTNLRAEGAVTLQATHIADCLSKSLCATLDRTGARHDLTAEELAECELLEIEVGSDDYVLGPYVGLSR